MRPGRFDLDLYRGDSYAWRFQLWQDAEKTSPVDLAGAEVRSEIRDRPGGAAITELGCVVELPNDVNVTLTAEQCADCPSKGQWDLQLTFADGTVRTPVAGSVMTTADVTDSTPTIGVTTLRTA